jgi:hypothetical protein
MDGEAGFGPLAGRKPGDMIGHDTAMERRVVTFFCRPTSGGSGCSHASPCSASSNTGMPPPRSQASRPGRSARGSAPGSPADKAPRIDSLADGGGPPWRLWLAIVLGCGYIIAFLAAPIFPAGLLDPDQPPISRLWRWLELITLPETFYGLWTGFGHYPLGLLDRAPLVLAAAIWLGLATWLGTGLLIVTGTYRRLNRAERLSLATTTGLIGLSSWTLLLGYLGLLGNRWPLSLSLALAAVAVAGVSWHRRRPPAGSTAAALPGGDQPRAPASIGELPTSLQRRLAGMTVVSCGLLCGLYVLAACMPPSEFDTLEYHLQAPKEFAAAGRIGFVPHNVYANMPLGSEMHSLAWMVLVGGSQGWFWGGLIGKLVLAAGVPLMAGLIGGSVYRFFGLLPGWIAALCVMTTPGWIEVAGHGLIDHQLGLYLSASLVAYLAAARHGTPDASPHLDGNHTIGSGVLIGCQLGGAIACKYTGLLLVGVPLCLLWLSNRMATRRRWPHVPHEPRTPMPTAAGLALIVAAALTGGGWYIKNAWLTGNPVYPLLGSWLGSRDLSPEQLEQWRAAHPLGITQPLTLERLTGELLDLLFRWPMHGLVTMPLMLIAMAGWWYDRRPAATPQTTAGQQFRPISCRIRQVLTWWLVGVLLWWLATHRLERFYLPLLSPLAWLAGAGAAQLIQHRLTGLLALWLAIGSLYGGMLSAAWWPRLDNRWLVSLESLRRDEPPESILRLLDASDQPDASLAASRVMAHHRWLNDHLAADQRLLLVGDAAVYNLEMPIAYATCFNRSLLDDVLERDTPEQQLQLFRDEKLTHLLIHWGEIGRYRSPGNYGFSSLITPEAVEQLQRTELLEEVDWPFNDRGIALYRIVTDVLDKPLSAADTDRS